jgi:hypothetical protein
MLSRAKRRRGQARRMRHLLQWKPLNSLACDGTFPPVALAIRLSCVKLDPTGVF